MASTAPDNKTCTPRICGSVPELDHATTTIAGEEATYDTSPWEYTCADGYALNGQASGERLSACDVQLQPLSQQPRCASQ